jgi:hypothetical protein
VKEEDPDELFFGEENEDEEDDEDDLPAYNLEDDEEDLNPIKIPVYFEISPKFQLSPGMYGQFEVGRLRKIRRSFKIDRKYNPTGSSRFG